MLKLRVNSEKRYVFNSFFDVTLNQLKEPLKWLSKQDKELLNAIFQEEPELNEKTIDVMIAWIMFFSDFKRVELENISVTDETDLSLTTLFSHCALFMAEAPHIFDVDKFKHKGIEYKLLEPLKTIDGTKVLLGNASYKQFMLSTKIDNLIKKGLSDSYIDCLIQCLALFYTDGDDSNEGINKRVEEFGEIQAIYGYNAWFFFVVVINKYNDFFQSCLTRKMTKLQAKAILKERILKLCSRITIGRWSETRLQKMEFLILST